MTFDLVESCKEEIRRRADFMDLAWKEEDLIHVDCGEYGTVVFLRRFNPEVIYDDQGEVVLDKDHQPMIAWKYSIYLEEMSGGVKATNDGDKFTLSVPVPRVCVPCPQLVGWVEPDGSVRLGM